MVVQPVFSSLAVFLEVAIVLMWSTGARCRNCTSRRSHMMKEEAHLSTRHCDRSWAFSAHTTLLDGTTWWAPDSTCLVLKWCLTMLQPQAQDGATASQLEQVSMPLIAGESKSSRTQALLENSPGLLQRSGLMIASKNTPRQPQTQAVTSVRSILQT